MLESGGNNHNLTARPAICHKTIRARTQWRNLLYKLRVAHRTSEGWGLRGRKSPNDILECLATGRQLTLIDLPVPKHHRPGIAKKEPVRIETRRTAEAEKFGRNEVGPRHSLRQRGTLSVRIPMLDSITGLRKSVESFVCGRRQRQSEQFEQAPDVLQSNRLLSNRLICDDAIVIQFRFVSRRKHIGHAGIRSPSNQDPLRQQQQSSVKVANRRKLSSRIPGLRILYAHLNGKDSVVEKSADQRVLICSVGQFLLPPARFKRDENPGHPDTPARIHEEPHIWHTGQSGRDGCRQNIADWGESWRRSEQCRFPRAYEWSGRYVKRWGSAGSSWVLKRKFRGPIDDRADHPVPPC